MNSSERGIPDPENEIDKLYIENRRKEKSPSWTPQELALALGFEAQPHEKGDPVQVYHKSAENGHVYKFCIQNSKYSSERGVRISLGVAGMSKEVILCQDKPFDDDMKELGLVTRTSAKMFWRPELQTKEIFEKLQRYIRDLEESNFFEDLLKT